MMFIPKNLGITVKGNWGWGGWLLHKCFVGSNAGGLLKDVNFVMKSGLIFVNLNYEKPQKYRD